MRKLVPAGVCVLAFFAGTYWLRPILFGGAGASLTTALVAAVAAFAGWYLAALLHERRRG